MIREIFKRLLSLFRQRLTWLFSHDIKVFPLRTTKLQRWHLRLHKRNRSNLSSSASRGKKIAALPIYFNFNLIIGCRRWSTLFSYLFINHTLERLFATSSLKSFNFSGVSVCFCSPTLQTSTNNL